MTAKFSLTGGTALLHAERTIECAGRTFEPDLSAAYFEFRCAFSYPVLTSDKLAFHPAVVARSFHSMQDKMVNLGHIIRSYDPKANPRDEIKGCVLAVEFPPEPAGGWTVPANVASAPGIRGVGVLFKSAEYVPEILGQYLGGRVRWTCSLEAVFSELAFLVGDDEFNKLGIEESFRSATPPDLRAHQMNFVPWAQSGPRLRAAVDDELKFKTPWKNRSVAILAGGIDGEIHFGGLALTPAGKEPTAVVPRIIASAESAALAEPLAALPELEKLLHFGS